MLLQPTRSSPRAASAGPLRGADGAAASATLTLEQAAGEDAYTTVQRAALARSSPRGEPAAAAPAPTPRGPSPALSPQSVLAAQLRAVAEAHPGANLMGVALADVGRKLRRNILTVAPTVVGFVVGFLAAQGLMVESGFNRIFAIPAKPFNPSGADHRGQGAALIGWALAGGIASSILWSTVGQAGGGALQARLQPGRRLPASPVADILVADAGALVGRHRRRVAPAFLSGLAGFVVPQCLATHAAFNFLDHIEAKPFNPEGGINRTLASALLGWGLSMSVLAGLPLGILSGVLVGRLLEPLWGPKI